MAEGHQGPPQRTVFIYFWTFQVFFIFPFSFFPDHACSVFIYFYWPPSRYRVFIYFLLAAKQPVFFSFFHFIHFFLTAQIRPFGPWLSFKAKM